MKTKPETLKLLVCTTAHLPIWLAERLDGQFDCPEGVVYDNVTHGWLIRYWPRKGSTERRELWDEIPQALRDVLEAAEKASCLMVLFDNDAKPLDGIKTYEWTATP